MVPAGDGCDSPRSYTATVISKQSGPWPSVHLVAAARTPFGRFFGALAGYRSHELAARAIDRVVEALPREKIGGVYAGVGMLAGGIYSPARQAVLASSLPAATPSTAIDRACASGMSAIGAAWRELRTGGADCLLAGGFDSLSRTPGLVPRIKRARPGAASAWAGPGDIVDPLRLQRPGDDMPIAQYTGVEALARGITRDAQDDWACQSHARFFAAEDRGAFEGERFALPELATDEAPRRSLGRDALARLEPLYGSPTVTAGNAPGLSDGAAFLALATDRQLTLDGRPSLGCIRDHLSVAGPLTSSSWLPAVAIRQLLQRQGLDLADIALLEIGEAYAATVLVSLLELAGGDRSAAAALAAITNVNGGAVAIGHPLGASGARLVMTLAMELRRRGGGRGIAAICGAFGQAEAVLLEVG